MPPPFICTPVVTHTGAASASTGRKAVALEKDLDVNPAALIGRLRERPTKSSSTG